jgi:hypothetical protein
MIKEFFSVREDSFLSSKNCIEESNSSYDRLTYGGY